MERKEQTGHIGGTKDLEADVRHQCIHQWLWKRRV